MPFKLKDYGGSDKLSIPQENCIILIVGGVGSGKSTLVNNLAYHYYNHNYKVVYVTEKPKSAMENCYMMFPPKEKYHIEDLWRQRFFQITNKEYDPLDIEIYHPFTFKIKKFKFPKEFKFFSINIKELSRTSFSSILMADLDSQVVNVCFNTLKRLKRKDINLFSFINEVYVKVKKGLYSNDIKSFGIPIGMEGTKQTIERIKSSFSDFTDDFFIREPTCPYNLDYIKILNNNKITFFTYKFIKDIRIRYFLQNHILERIDEAISSGKIKKPVLLVLEEIKILLPKTVSSQMSYQMILSNKLREMLSGLRSQGRGVTVIATTQSYYGTNPEFRSTITDIILMKLNLEDIRGFKRDFNISPETEELLLTMQRGQCILLKDILNRYARPYRINLHLPPFCISEEYYPPFLNYYSKHHKENLRDIKNIYNEFKEALDNQWSIQREIKHIDKEKSKQKKVTKKKEIVIIKNDKDTSKQEFCYKILKENKDMSFNSIAKKYNINVVTLRRNAILECLRLNDHELLNKIATKEFVINHLKKYYDEIFTYPKLI